MNQGTTLLIVDDNTDNQDLLQGLLADDGYSFICASSGAQALAVLQQHKIDMVLLDVMMPDMDGFETCRHIRATPAVADVPVVMVTALDDRQARLTGIEAGADDFVCKPLDEEEIRVRVRSISRLNRYRRILEQAEQVAYLESYDPLTNLPNRKLFLQRIDEALVAGPIAVLCVGLDGFDQVNDTLGHAVGDRILTEAAARLSECITRSDTMARLGGAKFVMLLASWDDPTSEAEACARRVQEALGQAFAAGNQPLFLNANIGITLGPQDSRSGDGLTSNAATAMARARDGGADGQRFFSDEMNITVLRRFTAESRLRIALEQEQFQLRFQPRYETLSGAVSGLDALLYWSDRGREQPLSQSFLDIAAEAGLIEALGEWQLYAVCGQLRRWQDNGLNMPRVALHVSSPQLGQPGFTELVSAALAANGVRGAALELALAEAALALRNGQQELDLEDIFADLKSQGLYLALDRFGQGALSLSQLASLPVDAFNIDAHIVQSLFSSINHGMVAKSIIGLAHNLERVVLAKGVETEEQRAFLLSWECDQVQGELLSPALTAESAVATCLEGGRTEHSLSASA